MAKINKTPWLRYAGQDTAEILAHKETHAIASLLCALEEAIQLRQARFPEQATTAEEHTLLAVMALQREVNNGGFHQFFFNSSRRYAPTIVSALESIGCAVTAALTQKAVEQRETAEALNALDNQFYRIVEIEPKLFAFVESRAQAFAIEKMSVPPPPPERGNPNLIMLGVGLNFAKPALTFEAARRAAAEVAAKKEIEPSDAELDGAAYLYLFESFLKAGEMEQCEKFAGPAFDLARENTSHCVAQRKWVETLMEHSNFTRADEITLQYLEYLKGDDTSQRFIRNRIKYWADPLRKQGANLPRSTAFFQANFPEIGLSR